MRGPAGRQDEIAWSHMGALAIHRRVAALALDNEPDRCRGVPVHRGHFPGHHQLQPGVKAVRDPGTPAEAGVFQHQHPALGFLRGDQFAGFEQQRTQLLVMPHRRQAGGFGLGCDQVAQHFPQRSRALDAEALIEFAPYIGNFRRYFRHSEPPPPCSQSFRSRPPPDPRARWRSLPPEFR